MSEESVQLELPLPLLFPSSPDGAANLPCEPCTDHLVDNLARRRGISRVHLNRDSQPAQICLHYDPNLVSLAAVQRLARITGSDFNKRYRHERFAVSGMDAADAADTLADRLTALPGMLHASVNYAASLAFVAYDTRQLDRAQVDRAVQQMGYRSLDEGLPAGEKELYENQGLAKRLAGQLQEHWELILVGLAGLFMMAGWLGQTFFGMPENLALVFYIAAYLAGGYEPAGHAIPGLFRGKFDTDVLMLAAAGGAAVLGQWAEGAFLLFLFGLGHAGEHYALGRARRAIDALGELMPTTARVKQGGAIVELPVEAIGVGDLVVIRPGDRIPVDGRVRTGRSAVDQSPITGESLPVNKSEGDEVFAGTINQENALEVRVTKLAGDNTLSRVMAMVAEAQEQQSPTQQFTQRFTARFVTAVLILAALMILVPPLLGWMPLENSFYRAMLLLVAASPCALALGTPAAVLAGIAQAARNGVLIKGGIHLENLGSIQTMAFDKTGTLTKGAFQVTDIVVLNGYRENELLSLAGAVEQQSSHPLAAAVVREAQARKLALPPVTGLENLAGHGVRSQVDGWPVLIGSLKLFEEAGSLTVDDEIVRAVKQLESAGKTTMAVSHAGRFLGLLALADIPRPGIKETMQQLSNLGIRNLVMLTGDNETVARQIGQAVGMTDVRAGLLPADKLAAIKQLQQEQGAIAMTGDGVNDAPALAMATVGIAMGGAGTAVALETADVALMADDLSKLPFAVGLSRASRAVIRQNLALALGVMFLLVLTSVLGFVQLGGAVIFHEGSTIVVVLNALRLLRYRGNSL